MIAVHGAKLKMEHMKCLRLRLDYILVSLVSVGLLYSSETSLDIDGLTDAEKIVAVREYRSKLHKTNESPTSFYNSLKKHFQHEKNVSEELLLLSFLGI